MMITEKDADAAVTLGPKVQWSKEGQDIQNVGDFWVFPSVTKTGDRSMLKV